MSKKIILAAGGSGGHLYPALALARHLNACAVLFTSDRAVDDVICRQASILREKLRFNPYRRSVWARMLFAFRLLADTLYCIVRLKCIGAHLVIGFGGTVSAAPVLAARILGKKCIIYESNEKPGKANRFLMPFADIICTSASIPEDTYGKYGRKTVRVEAPLFYDRIIPKDQARQKLAVSPEAFLVVLIGGSQGARGINSLARDYYEHFYNPEENLYFIHVTGKGNGERTLPEHLAAGGNIRMIDYSHEIDLLYSAADLLIARAGATTINEIIHFQLPSILVPYAHAGGHQLENAARLVQNGCARLIREEDFTGGAAVLAKHIEEIKKSENYAMMKNALSKEKGRLSGQRKKIQDIIDAA